jgi:hypothetical protein
MPRELEFAGRDGWEPNRQLFVCNRTGSRTGDGTSRFRPFLTLSEALKRAADAGQNGSGDGVDIHVGPESSISVNAADFLSDLASKNVRLIGHNYPTLTWSTATSTILMDQDGFEMIGFKLLWAGPTGTAGALTVAAPMTASAERCRIANCIINTGVDADQIIGVGLTLAAGSNLFTLENNVLQPWNDQGGGSMADTALAKISAAGTIIRLTGSDSTIIRNNVIKGAFTTNTDGCIESLTTVSTNLTIEDNFIHANGSGNTCAVDFGAALALTGRMNRNLLKVPVDATAQAVIYTRDASVDMALGTDGNANHTINNTGERGLVLGTASV